MPVAFTRCVKEIWEACRGRKSLRTRQNSGRGFKFNPMMCRIPQCLRCDHSGRGALQGNGYEMERGIARRQSMAT